MFDGSDYNNMVQNFSKNEHCFQINVPQGKIKLKVDFYNCNNFTDHKDQEMKKVCSLRNVKCNLNGKKLVEQVNSILNLKSNNSASTLSEGLNISSQHLQTKLEQWITISSNETLFNILNLNETYKNLIIKTCKNETDNLKLKSDCVNLFNTSADEILSCLSSVSLEEKFIRGNNWLSGIVANFRLYVDFKNKTVPSNTYFTLFITKSKSEMDSNTQSKWFKLERNRATQEPSMGLHFHLNATDRLKKDQIYCRIGRFDRLLIQHFY